MICFGTFHRNSDLRELIPIVIHNGCNTFETASFYDNITFLSDGISKSKVSRNSLNIVLRICNYFISPITYLNNILKKTTLEYFDILLIHHYDKEEKWIKIYEDLLKFNKKISVGVSNFDMAQLDKFKAIFGFYPKYNEFESHIYYPQVKLKSFCNKNKIQVITNTILGRGKELNNSIIKKIASEYRVSPSQLLINLSLREDDISIFSSSNAGHIIENLRPIDIKFTKNDLLKLKEISYPNDYGRIIKKKY